MTTAWRKPDKWSDSQRGDLNKPSLASWLRSVRQNRLITLVLLAAVGLRVVTMLGYRPPMVYWVDSINYLDLALELRPSGGYQPGGFQPSGYPALLWLLRPLHSVMAVAGLQHVMGLAIGLMIYLVLRRRGLPAWGATLAAAPGLLDARFLRLEHGILSDTLFLFFVVAAITVLLWSPVPTMRAVLAAGLLLAAASLTRTIAVPLILLALGHLLLQRAGLRRTAVLAVAALLPLVAYASWFASVHGRFTLASGDGVSLWARSMTYADCKVIDPPPELAYLCPNGSWQDAASEYVWASDSAINLAPGGLAGNNEAAREFGLLAMNAQPIDYLHDVVSDTALAFTWDPVPHPRRMKPAHGFAHGCAGPLPDHEMVERVLRDYDHAVRAQCSVDPYAGFLVDYQHVAYLRGTVLGGIFLVGMAGMVGRRRLTLLPWTAAFVLLVAPVAALDFDHRYLLPVIPMACLAAGLGAAEIRTSRRRRHRAGPAAPAAGAMPDEPGPKTTNPQPQVIAVD